MNDPKIITLKNGLRVILVPNKSTEVVTTIVMFKVGSRNETEENAGISHILEHLCFKGTKKRPTAHEMSEFVDSLGAENNAFTGKEVTAYFVKARPKNLEKSFDYLSDMLLNSLYRQEDLDREKNVIIQEINMYQDLPMNIVEENFEKALFGPNALGRQIIGYKKTVNTVSSKNLFDYRDAYYQGRNGVLVLAGNFGDKSETDIETIAEKYFRFNNEEAKKPEKIDLKRSELLTTQIKKTEQSHIILGFNTVPQNHPDFFKLEILATLLGGSMSSRMFEEVRERRGLAYAVKTRTSSYTETSTLFTQAGVEHDKVEEAFSAIAGEYRKIKKEKVDKTELAKAKEVRCGRFLIGLEDSEELACHFATEALLSDKILTPKEIIEKYQSVTTEDIMEIANKYLVEDKMVASFVGPKINKEKVNSLIKL
jgi:predicted Zn-dependent peptidase